MNGKQLKNSILQWAIQGELAPQDPNDEPASVLLDKIRQEKERLIKEKKIKRDKNASIIYRGEDNSYYEKILATGEVKCIDEEVPFEIPQGWKWCRLNEVATSVTDFVASGSFASLRENVKYYSTKEYALLVRTKDLSCNFSNDLVYTDKHGYDFLSNSNLFGGELILPNIGASIGKVFIVPNLNMPMTLAPNSVMIRLDDECTKSWLYNVFSSPFGYDTLWSISSSTAQGKFNKTDFRKVLVPIPPIEEQNRIVTKIKELSPYIEKYSKAQEHLDVWNVAIKEILQKSILQEAIQGKLVPQIAEEGTAQELLEQIKTEKQKLVKEGKLKKSALNDSIIFRGDDNKYYEQIGSEVTEIELPFDFPSSWSIARLNAVCQLTDGLKTTGKQCLLDAKYLRGKSSETTVEQGKLVYKGDNIMLVDGENSGEVFIVPQDGYMGSTFKQLWISSSMHEPYVLAFIQFYKETLRNSKKGAAIPHLNKELFYGLIIGIPPLQEQRRIVLKIEQSSQLLR